MITVANWKKNTTFYCLLRDGKETHDCLVPSYEKICNLLSSRVYVELKDRSPYIRCLHQVTALLRYQHDEAKYVIFSCLCVYDWGRIWLPMSFCFGTFFIFVMFNSRAGETPANQLFKLTQLRISWHCLESIATCCPIFWQAISSKRLFSAPFVLTIPFSGITQPTDSTPITNRSGKLKIKYEKATQLNNYTYSMPL